MSKANGTLGIDPKDARSLKATNKIEHIAPLQGAGLRPNLT